MTRQWLEQARKFGQTPSPAAADGTFAAGVNHVTELLPSFMTDILNTAPEEQKVRFLEMLHNTIAKLEYMAANEARDPSVYSTQAIEKLFRVFRILYVLRLTYSCILGQDKEAHRYMGAW